ncbi:MAG: SDR family oxidoreductase [Pseudomonadota bacterium]
MEDGKHLFCFGMGYSARVFAQRCQEQGWKVTGTSRTADGVARIQAAGADGLLFDGYDASPELQQSLQCATHVLVSAGPDDGGDPVLRGCATAIAKLQVTKWIGYLSTVGVYGDHGGAWVDEATQVRPKSQRSIRRVAAENAWLAFADGKSWSLQVFRLAGIYGPGRSAVDKLRNGTARRLIKPGQVFNRIHVQDIANVLAAGLANAEHTGIFNVTDDEPAPPQDVVAYAAELMGLPEPPDLPFDTADLSPMARSFYSENKRCRNDRIKTAFGVQLDYPTYREGLAALVAQT